MAGSGAIGERLVEGQDPQSNTAAQRSWPMNRQTKTNHLNHRCTVPFLVLLIKISFVST